MALQTLRRIKGALFPPPIHWAGDYSSWGDVSQQTEGYANPEILKYAEESFTKLLSGKIDPSTQKFSLVSALSYVSKKK